MTLLTHLSVFYMQLYAIEHGLDANLAFYTVSCCMIFENKTDGADQARHYERFQRCRPSLWKLAR